MITAENRTFSLVRLGLLRCTIPMPRGPKAQPDYPYALWLLKVEPRNRVRMPSEVGSIVKWLGASAVECIGRIGPLGGLWIEPAQDPIANLRPAIERYRTEHTADEPWEFPTPLEQYVASTWIVKLKPEGGGGAEPVLRYSFYLPEEAIKLGLVPGPEKSAAVFASRNTLCVWTKEAWVRNGIRTARKLTEMIDQLGPL